MSKQAFTFKSYLQKCKQYGTSCFWRIHGLLIIWFSLSQAINFGYAIMKAQITESTPLIQIPTFAIALFLNFVYALAVIRATASTFFLIPIAFIITLTLVTISA